MLNQTATRAAESIVEPDKLYHVLAEATNIPKWAPVFPDTVERIDDTHYHAVKNGETFSLEISLHPSAHAVDYIREMSGGKRGGAYIRVMSRPLGGSTIAITVPIGPATMETAVAKTLELELADLIWLAST